MVGFELHGGCARYRVDITSAARPGINTLAVKIANTWVNRLIGDQQPGAHRETFTVIPIYLPTAPLRPTGLIGPVTLYGVGHGCR